MYAIVFFVTTNYLPYPHRRRFFDEVIDSIDQINNFEAMNMGRKQIKEER